MAVQFSDVFSFSLFFIILRETLEASIVVSVLLSFIDKNQELSTHSRLKRMVWLGTGCSFTICLIIGSIFIGVWYGYGRNLFEENEVLIEGILMLIASAFITITGIAFANGSTMYQRLEQKLQKKIEDAQEDIKVFEVNEDESYNSSTSLVTSSVEKLFFWVPFVTVLREGLEAVLLMGGVAFNEPPSSIPLAALLGIAIGAAVGLFIHRASGKLSLRFFFVLSAYILLIMAAGFFARAIFEFQEYSFIQELAKQGITGEAAEVVAPFPRNQLIWWFPYASEDNFAWGLFSTIFGFKNMASLAYVLAYCLYWLSVFITLIVFKAKFATTH